MSAVTVTVETTIDGVQSILQSIGERVDDLSLLMQQIAPILGAATSRAFATESTPQGSRWAELALSTQKKKKPGGGIRGAHPILQSSGTFINSILTQFGSDFAEVGSPIPGYPSYLVTGTSKMPARSPFGLSDADETEIIDTCLEYLASL